ncbi:hypothetical protein GWO43_11345 [candidate division KSB1 bacterium]|nr:hypothetical protein [candidate division KSB1 bacterium]NIR70597.1 hypothetical protein [candidate division KSB1 bacterium]NIS24542.1 hypothetical protein [candidate division KSB1 bacterium]NIT71460.1 hypothetical protein [candidate division KSB1 bacterium]NIU25151.1 hypothetical protein [candidate division KSB1 bacterium]
MARLYSNENFPIPVVEELRKLGHDVLTIQETGKADQSLPDEEGLQEASVEKRAVLTFNRKHFVALHKSRPNHEGIIACTFDVDFIALANRIHQALKSDQTLTGRLVRINRRTKK